MRSIKFTVFNLLLFSVAACNSSGTNEQSYISGQTKILVDESFAPVIEDQAYIFENTYKNAKFEMIYKPENEVLNSFLKDSIDVVILSRELRPQEAKVYENRKIKIRTTKFATDGVALITQRSNPDSVITVAEVVNIMQGKSPVSVNLVFDNPNSSTVRYLMELANINKLPSKGVYALKSNQDVIRYVHDNPKTIGVVGINWIREPQADVANLVAQLKVMGVKNLPGKPGDDGFYKPNQNDLAQGLYPLTRSLYIINCEGGPGLGTGFASFLAGEKGQRIVLQSGLMPDSLPPREVIMDN